MSAAALAVIMYLSVRLSLASRSSTKTAKQFQSHNQRRIIAPRLLFYYAKDIYERGRQMHVVEVKFTLFDRSRSLWLIRLTADNLRPSATVVLVHDGALAEKYAVLSSR